MKFLMLCLLMFVSACSTNQRNDYSELVVNIPMSEVAIDSNLNFPTSNPPTIALEVPVRQDEPQGFLMGCGFYIPETPQLASMSLTDIESEYSGLIVSTSYKKWIPIEGEPKTVLVFQFYE